MKKFLLLTSIVLLFTPAFSQTVALSDTASIANISKLLDLTGTTKLQKQIMGSMIDNFKQTLPDVSNDFWDEFEKQVDYTELTRMLIPVYQKHFTNEDILEIITFYESRAGQKYIQEIPAIMQESMLIGQEWGQTLALKVQEELEKKDKK